MKILLASSSSGSRGGGELYLIYLGRALAQRGHTVTLWASDHPRMDELANTFSGFGEVLRSRYHNTYDRRGRSLASYANVRASWQVSREWRSSGADFLHLNKQNLEDGLDLLRAATWSGKPSLCTIHLTQSARYLEAKFPRLRDWVARRALSAYPGLLVTVLENRRRDLLRFLGPNPRVRMIPNGVPLPDLSRRQLVRDAKRAELGFAKNDVLFLAVGRMVEQKRPLLFLEHAEALSRMMPEARFLWIGDGALASEWDAWVTARGLEKVIRRMPWQVDVLPFLLAADVFMHTAEFEGLPLAILEALAAALPCLLTPNLLSDMPFLSSETALTYGEPGDPTWIAPLRDVARLRAMGQAGRTLAEREFSFTKMAESYELLYAMIRRQRS